MKTSNKAKRTETIISTSVILMLVGFLYTFYLLNNLNDSVEEKKQELSNLNSKIVKNKDSLNFIDQKLKLKQVLLDSILKQVEESNNEVLQAKVLHDLEVNQMMENTLKTSVLDTVYEQIVYVQVNDSLTRSYIESTGLLDTLNGGNCIACGYDVQPNLADNTIRYFHIEDKEDASILKKKTEKATGIVIKELYVKGYEEKVPKKQFEIWLKKTKNDSL